MAQGKLKTKASTVAKKAKTQKKSLGPKKGRRAIARKKNVSHKVTTVKKKLEVQINTSIVEAAVKEAAKESKPLKVVKPQSEPVAKKNTQRGKGAGKKNGRKGK